MLINILTARSISFALQYLFAVVLINDCKISAIYSSTKSGYEQTLLEKLLKNYNKKLRPPGTIQVKFALNLNQIINLIEKDQIIVINAFIDHEWVDKRLSWDPKEFGNLTLMRISGDQVWTPDTFVYTTADQSGFLLPQNGAYFVIRHEGIIFWPNPLTQMRLRCRMGIIWFPFDEQLCVIVFGSWSYTQFYLNYTLMNENPSLENYTEHNEWVLKAYKPFRSEITYDNWIENDTFSEVRYKILIKRKPLFVLQNCVIPALMLCTLTLVSFFIPFGQEMQIGISIMLSFSVFKLRLSDDVPVQSDSVPLINIYFTLCMSTSLLSMVWFSLMNLLRENKKVPTFIRYLVVNYICYVMCISEGDRPRKNDSSSSSSNKNSKSKNEEITMIIASGQHPQSPSTIDIYNFKNCQKELINNNDYDVYQNNRSPTKYDNVTLMRSRYSALLDHESFHYSKQNLNQKTSKSRPTNLSNQRLSGSRKLNMADNPESIVWIPQKKFKRKSQDDYGYSNSNSLERIRSDSIKNTAQVDVSPVYENKRFPDDVKSLSDMYMRGGDLMGSSKSMNFNTSQNFDGRKSLSTSSFKQLQTQSPLYVSQQRPDKCLKLNANTNSNANYLANDNKKDSSSRKKRKYFAVPDHISDIAIINTLNKFVFFLFLIFILCLNVFGLYLFPYYLKQPLSIDD